MTKKDKYLTLVCSVSSQNAPEGLSVRTLWVHPFLNSLHLASLAAHVLLCLDVGGQIYRLQEGNNSVSYLKGRKTSYSSGKCQYPLTTEIPGVHLSLYY